MDPAAKKRILIVGGVAGGASCAARLRRLSESAEIRIFDRGEFVSFASCGLPYYVGDIIKNERDLLVATPALFKGRFNIDVKLKHEVLSIDRHARTIQVTDLTTGATANESYDNLVLAPGTSAKLPPIPGIDSPGIFTLRTIRDSHKIKDWIARRSVKKAVVVGAGFIGLETVENLKNLGLHVAVVEMLPQVLPNLDPEIASRLQEHLAAQGVELHPSDGVKEFDVLPDQAGIRLVLQSGTALECGVVLLATGVVPETSLARQAGLEIGNLGGIRVNDRMQTSDPAIWAVGDAVEVKNFISREWNLLALAGPASRQGRIAADTIMGRNSRFRGVEGTLVCEVLGLTVAATGLSERALAGLKAKIPYEQVYLHPGQHAGYYPGAKSLTVKLIFSVPEGKILGAQIVGEEGVEKRVDVISMAIQKGGTVYDLEEAEMCYAPQFGSAKDPINLAGMVAANALRGDSPVGHWDSLEKAGAFILDVREPIEFRSGHFAGAVNIPLNTLRARLGELPRDKEIQVYCAAGLRSYVATRILRQNGFSARNISGGMSLFRLVSGRKGGS